MIIFSEIQLMACFKYFKLYQENTEHLDKNKFIPPVKYLNIYWIDMHKV